MDLEIKTEWPETAPGIMGNPVNIEKFLKEEITSRQVTLIGELDLVAETSYAGVGWSLYELASYLANKNIIKNSLTAEQMSDWKYPATLAIWSVGKAQAAEDGAIKMWDLQDYSPGQLANLANMFTRSIEILGLPTFDGELLGTQKHVQLARIHAMIPDFATQRYSEIIHKAVKFNQPKTQILNHVIEDTIISKGVRRLFSARQEIGLDLIERSFNYIAYGYELDLPDRLKSKLNRGNIVRKDKQKSQDFPSVYFVEFAGAVEIRDGHSWQVVDESNSPLEHHKIYATNIYVKKDEADRIRILDISAGFLLFDINGKLIYGSSLPIEGGYLLWRNDVKLKTEIDHLDDGYLPLWPDWNFTFFHDLHELVLELADGSTKRFEIRKSISVIDFKVPNLQDENRNSVYSSYPAVVDSPYLKLTDNLTGSQIELVNHQGPVVSEPGGEIDMTLSSGLGKSVKFQGLVVPELTVNGIANALTLGSIAHVEVKLPIDWKFTYPEEFVGKSHANFDFKVDSNQTMKILKVKDFAAQEYFVGLEIPVISWSVEFSDRESVTIASTHQIDVASRKFVRAIILHGVNEYVPIVNVGGVPVVGRKRGKDARYDLRLLADVHGEEESSIGMKWNYQELDLVSFIKPKSKKMQTVDLRNLAAEAIARDIISADDWKNYQAATEQQSTDLRNLLRRQRGN